MTPNISYSQCGEDIIVDYVLTTFGILAPVYIDIGAHHPVENNNTYHFYLKGSMGILIEPNPDLYAGIKAVRPRDISLNVGIGSNEITMEYFQMSSNTLNTFSKENAVKYLSQGEQIVSTQLIPVFKINSILDKFFINGSKPNFISIDTEGLELDILRLFDFEKYRPEVFCIETINYSKKFEEQSKNIEVIEYMNDKGYFLYSDTFINSIFVDHGKLMNRG